MPTIKTKKEMNLPELIEWATSNNITNTFAELKKQWPIRQGIRIHNDGRLRLIEMEYLSKNDTFTVEIEEPITEDTVILRLVEFGNNGHGNDFSWHYNTSINEELDIGSEAFYILNDDLTMTLIWTKDKGMVD